MNRVLSEYWMEAFFPPSFFFFSRLPLLPMLAPKKHSAYCLVSPSGKAETDGEKDKDGATQHYCFKALNVATTTWFNDKYLPKKKFYNFFQNNIDQRKNNLYRGNDCGSDTFYILVEFIKNKWGYLLFCDREKAPEWYWMMLLWVFFIISKTWDYFFKNLKVELFFLNFFCF